MVDTRIGGEIVHMPIFLFKTFYFELYCFWDLFSEERHEQSSATVVMVVNVHNCVFLGLSIPGVCKLLT